MLAEHRTATAATTAVILLLASAAWVGGVQIARSGEILPGVTVEGVPVGGLGEDDARSALADAVTARRSQPVHVKAGGRRFTIRPGKVGLSVDLDATIEQARAAGRGGGPLQSTWHHLDAAWHDIDTDLVTTLDRKRLDARIAAIAKKVDTTPSSGAIEADPATLEVAVTLPRNGSQVRRDPAAAAVAEAFRAPGVETLELPTKQTQTPIAAAQVRRVADRARNALAEPIVLRGAGTQVVLEPAQIAPLLRLRRQGEGEQASVSLHVPPKALRRSLRTPLEPFNVEPTRAGFDLARQPPTTLEDQDATTWEPVPVDAEVVPGSTGTRVNYRRTARQLTRAFRRGQRSVQLDLETVEPELTTQQARKGSITHLLGTFTTHHACCQTRVTNIQRLADMVDGTIVQPGEQFSVNQISGVRGCDKGFEPAGTIIAGELVDTCGGGVSQFGTTTFNAAFFAGVPIDSYKAHSWYISRYPMGREATLNYPSPDIDVRFTNDTDNVMLVRTAYTDTSITVSIYGSSDVTKVEATLGEPYDFTESSTKVRTDESLPPGTSQVVQSGDGGFSVKVRRIVTYASGEQETRTFTTVYEPRTQIIERNPTEEPTE